ncbi:TonB-dependent receptor [Wohlfahrtiimonas larvae]|uniref:TonB-dependent siderophore receptor n=1 Tax=Wohlfahrtiimonas larvae TaxID=1157986 RepID=A0ABP9MR31_9GAMM|nr:TonB-dependent siderophore receptor [Wohlfahrtiimonas larvae]
MQIPYHQKSLVLTGLTFSLLVNITPTLAEEKTTEETDNVITLDAVKVYGGLASANTPYSGGQVTTGSRIGLLGDKDFMETPFNTISYTEKFMENQQVSDIQQVISKTDPTVFSSGIPGESNEGYSIRGFSSASGDVTLNGLPGVAGYYRNLPEMFERVEVLKGPSALLNGMPPKGSVGGSVNLVTKRAGDDPLTRITASYMSKSHFGGHVDLGRRFGQDKQLGVRFNGVYKDGETAVKNQDKRASLGSLGLDFRGEGIRLSADVYHSKDRVDGLTRGISLAPGLAVPKPPKKGNVSWNPPWAFYDTTDKGMMLRGELDLTDQLMVYATGGISKTDFNSHMAAPLVFNQAGDFRTNFSGVSDSWTRKSMELGLQGKASTGSINHQFAINFTHYNEDYRLNGYRSIGPSGDWVSNIYNPIWGPALPQPSPIPAISKTKMRLTSFGIADTLSVFDDKIQLTLGVRHQQVMNESFNAMTGARMGERYKESATTPAAALVFRATDKISLYANYTEGLNQGSIAPATAANAGEVFAPYKTKQKEMGIKFDFGDFSQTISLYEIKRPSSYTDPTSNIFSFGGEQRNRGVEWSFFGSPLEGVRLMGGVAYSDPKITKTANSANKGKLATGLPKWQGKLGAEWDIPQLQGMTLTANVTTMSKQYINADNSLSIPGHTVFDLGVRYTSKVAGNPITVRAAVTNVGNKAYWSKANFTNLGMGAPRTFNLSMTMDF